MKSYMKDVVWDCITILLFWCQQTVTEPQYKQIEQSLQDTSRLLLAPGANLAEQYAEKILTALLKDVSVIITKPFF